MEFKQLENGQQLETSIKDNREELTELKKLVREHTEVCNAAKKKIDQLKTDLEKKIDERKANNHAHMAAVEDEELFNDDDGGPQEIIDEEELALL